MSKKNASLTCMPHMKGVNQSLDLFLVCILFLRLCFDCLGRSVCITGSSGGGGGGHFRLGEISGVGLFNGLPQLLGESMRY